MKHSRIVAIAVLLLALVAILAACGGEPTPAPTDTVPPPTSTPMPPAELSLDELSSPSDLTSYRANITMRISGTDAGEAIDTSLEFLMEYTGEPQAQHIRMSGQGMEEIESMGVVDMYQVEDTTYIQFGDQWLSVPTTDEITATMGIIQPQDLLDDTCGWQQQGYTEYEGIETQHWTLSTVDVQSCMTAENMGGIGNITEASGSLYLTKDGKHIVHMDMILAGSQLEASLGGEGQVLDEGRMEITFDVRDINQPLTIEVPQEALASGALPEDIPIPEDAEELTNAFGVITYKTAQTPAEISEYYRAQMPANGWTEVSAEELSGMFMLEYSKEGRTVTMTINADEDSGRTSVLIEVAEPES